MRSLLSLARLALLVAALAYASRHAPQLAHEAQHLIHRVSDAITNTERPSR